MEFISEILRYLPVWDDEIFYIDQDGDKISLNFVPYASPDGEILINQGLDYDEDNVKYLIQNNIISIMVTLINDLCRRQYFMLTFKYAGDGNNVKIDDIDLLIAQEIPKKLFENNICELYNTTSGLLTKSTK